MNTRPDPTQHLGTIPAPDAGWNQIGAIALGFDGYAYHGRFEACGEIVNQWQDAYQAHQLLPADLGTLRTCLLFEQRRWRHYGYAPDEEAMAYIHALLSRLREIAARNPRPASRDRGRS